MFGLIVVALAAVAGVWWGPWQDAGQAELTTDGTYEVTRGDLTVTLSERGTLKTRKAQAVRSQIRGRARIEWLVDEGATVEPEQVLVELDKTDLEKEIEDLDNRVIQLESELKAAETEVTIQVAQNLTDTEKAALQLEVATVTLEKFQEGDVPQETRRLGLAIDRAKTDLERAQYRFKTMPEMLEKGFVTEDQFKEEELNVTTAEKELESAKLALQLYQEYQLPLDVKEKTAAVTEAERNVERAKQQAEARLEGKRAVVRQKKRSLDAARERLAKATEDLSNMTLRAESGGVVFYGDPDNSRRAEEIKVGAEVWPNRTILTIPDPTRMMASIKVHESDIAKVREGVAATVRSEVKRNLAFKGAVSRIDSVANAGNRRWGDNVRRFDVEIDIEDTTAELKPGTSAEVELDLGTVEEILFVPLQAVHPRDGRFYVYRWIDGRPTRTRVRLGQSNEAFVEVRSGLGEGERVLLYEPEPGDVVDPEGDAEPDGESEGDRSKAVRGDGNSAQPAGRPGGDRRGWDGNRGGSSGRPGSSGASRPERGERPSGSGRPRGGDRSGREGRSEKPQRGSSSS
ncbi:MAG: efflux RND transporter periplasmic adaptor subunit [Planctomycetota bacterium]